ncbi:hypothetical protein [Parafilimonas sp.]|uniref:hypothetical protein n=1 Tax=Parafilimonas sp. TaxID=1969739 RepID=UPI0039E33942
MNIKNKQDLICKFPIKSFVLLAGIILISITRIYAQQTKVIAYDGIVIAGYVDKGGFANFIGPGLSLTSGNSKYIISMLPSLRFKEDKATPKNSFVTPTLGAGFTYAYKHLSFQLPLYYQAKTSAKNGKWLVGVGLGWRLNKPAKK